MWRLLVFLVVVLAFVYYVMLIAQTAGLIQFTNRKLKPSRMYIPFYYWLASDQEEPRKEKSKLVKPFKSKDNGELSRNGNETAD